MRSFRVIIALISLVLLQNCATNGVSTVKETEGRFHSMPAPPMITEKQVLTLPGMMWNGIQYMRFSLNKQEKQMHQSAVYHSLNNAHIGEMTSWYSKTRKAAGKVRVIHQFPTSDGWCRMYQAYIRLNGAQRHMTNKACKTPYTGWVFVK